MIYSTIGKVNNDDKIALTVCEHNGCLDDINIKGNSFLLIFLTNGAISLSVCEKVVSATAPSFLCFNCKENPKLISKQKADYFCIYFHPSFLNVNMTFEILHSKKYYDIATTHDMFLLKPFLDGELVVPVLDTYQKSIETACINMMQELKEQRDWYWSCRSRSYFMEIIIALERMYGLIGYGKGVRNVDYASTVTNKRLRDAILFIESHYMQKLSLTNISEEVGINHNSLTKLFKAECNTTVIEYVMDYRIKVAKKQLAFTDVPIKELAVRCGFQTVQHFGRVFKKKTGKTPANFRKTAVESRKSELSKR